MHINSGRVELFLLNHGIVDNAWWSSWCNAKCRPTCGRELIAPFCAYITLQPCSSRLLLCSQVFHSVTIFSKHMYSNKAMHGLEYWFVYCVYTKTIKCCLWDDCCCVTPYVKRGVVVYTVLSFSIVEACQLRVCYIFNVFLCCRWLNTRQDFPRPFLYVPRNFQSSPQFTGFNRFKSH